MWLQDCFLKWWLHGPRYGWSKFRRCLFERGFLNVELPKVETLDDIIEKLHKVEWKKDWIPELFDCVSYPQRVWKRRKDDCDGFAVLAAALLKQLKTPSNPIMVTAMVNSINNCHSVCVFETDEGFKYFSNWELNPNTFNSYEEIVKDFVGTKYRLICWDEVDPDTLKQLKFHPVK